MKDFVIKEVETVILKYHTRDPFELCEKMNINVYFHDLGGILKGYYLYHKNQHNIIVDSTLSKSEKRIVIGHELAHSLLHLMFSKAFTETTFENYNNDKIELQANIFCAELLITDEEIISLIKSNYPLDSIVAELCMPSWLIDCKIQALKNKGYDLPFLYIVNRNSIKK